MKTMLPKGKKRTPREYRESLKEGTDSRRYTRSSSSSQWYSKVKSCLIREHQPGGMQTDDTRHATIASNDGPQEKSSHEPRNS